MPGVWPGHLLLASFVPGPIWPGGHLKGLTYTEVTSVRFEVGREYGPAYCRYIITEVLPL